MCAARKIGLPDCTHRPRNANQEHSRTFLLFLNQVFVNINSSNPVTLMGFHFKNFCALIRRVNNTLVWLITDGKTEARGK